MLSCGLLLVRVCGVGYETKPLDYGYMTSLPMCTVLPCLAKLGILASSVPIVF